MTDIEPRPEPSLEERNAARLRTGIESFHETKFMYSHSEAGHYSVPEGFWEDLTADGNLTILITEARKNEAFDQNMPLRPDWSILVLRDPVSTPSIMTLFMSIDGHLEVMRDFEKLGLIKHLNTLYLHGKAHELDIDGVKLTDLFIPPDPLPDMGK